MSKKENGRTSGQQTAGQDLPNLLRELKTMLDNGYGSWTNKVDTSFHVDVNIMSMGVSAVQ